MLSFRLEVESRVEQGNRTPILSQNRTRTSPLIRLLRLSLRQEPSFPMREQLGFRLAILREK
jgi:hypothetical protein